MEKQPYTNWDRGTITIYNDSADKVRKFFVEHSESEAKNWTEFLFSKFNTRLSNLYRTVIAVETLPKTIRRKK